MSRINTPSHSTSQDHHKIEEQRLADIGGKMTAQRADREAAVEALVVETRALIADNDKSARVIAENFAKLAALGLKQREIADRVGTSQTRVNRYLKWRDGGYTEETPFTLDHEQTAKRLAANHQSEIEAAKAAATDTKTAGKPKSNVVTFRSSKGAVEIDPAALNPKAQAQIAGAMAGNDADPAESAATRKAAYAEPADPTPAKSTSGTRTQIKKGSQEWLLGELQYVVDHSFPRMTPETLAKAKTLVANWQPRKTGVAA
jgi:predicted transcriptional regulator